MENSSTTLPSLFPIQPHSPPYQPNQPDLSYPQSCQQHAKQALMSIPDYPDTIIQSTQDNPTSISSWNMNIAENLRINYRRVVDCQNNKRSPRARLRKINQRKSISQNSYVQTANNVHSLSVVMGLKKQLGKLQIPLKQKSINSQQFINGSTIQKQKQLPSYCRSKIRADIINSRQQITPLVPLKKKARTQHAYDSIIRPKENCPYQKIRRDLAQTAREDGIRNWGRMRERSFFLSSNLVNARKARLKAWGVDGSISKGQGVE